MNRFKLVYDFTLEEILLCFAIISLSYALAEAIFRGFDTFSQIIGNGEFDRILVRPRHPILQVLGSTIELTRIGRIIQSILIFIYIMPTISIVWTVSKVLTLVLMILCGTTLFASLFVLGAAISFFTLEGLEVLNILTDGGREFGQYPLAIYGEYVLKFFTYIVPIALVQYYPLLYLTNRSDNKWLSIVPLLANLFIIPVAFLWKQGMKHYQSTGS
ncbi:ABC transporter permease [Fundicoccus culcitae]|uniref:ABC-2 family transporter protein n=1 Tax=Fundicoccus culcitae TaxID=2969821 RepID=A0ABY5P5Y6_9LACT|nr:ABC-2 family transporter protein [Fundicoccus culcitae]UUX34131.1 ABC-2 family transporter protein [Fundicoccus culcitae]